MSEQISSNSNSKKPSGHPVITGVVVGVIMLIGQFFINPYTAQRIKIQESIAIKRYEACEKAIDILQRNLAASQIKGKNIHKGYVPPEKKSPTQLETNFVYTLLAIYGKSPEISEQFFDATEHDINNPSVIAKFVSAVRKELNVDKNGFTGEFKYRYFYPRDVNNIDVNNIEVRESKDDQKQ